VVARKRAWRNAAPQIDDQAAELGALALDGGREEADRDDKRA
jgi:hypothetical protein